MRKVGECTKLVRGLAQCVISVKMMYITKDFPMFMQMDYNDESAIIAID